MRVMELIPKRAKLSPVMQKIFLWFLYLKNEHVVCVRVAFMNQDVRKDSGWLPALIDCIARNHVESLLVPEMPVVFAIDGERVSDEARPRHVETKSECNGPFVDAETKQQSVIPDERGNCSSH